MSRQFKSLFILIIILLSACANQPEVPPLVGQVTTEMLFENSSAFEEKYQQHSKLATTESTINDWPDDLHIEVFFGTWCHDSRREVPKFLALMNAHPSVSYQLISLDFSKQDPASLAKANRVKFTPTFVIKRSGLEIGRIVEYTKESYVDDINEMLTTQHK